MPYPDTPAGTEDVKAAIQFCQLLLSLPAAADPEPVRQKLAQLEESPACFQAEHPFTRLRKIMGLDGLGWLCVKLSICCELDGSLRNQINEWTGSPVPTFDLAFSLHQLYQGRTELCELVQLLSPVHSPLRLALELEKAEHFTPRMFAPLRPRSAVLQYSVTGQVGGGSLCRLIQARTDRLPLFQPAFQALCDYIKEPGNQCIFLTGQSGSGKMTLVAGASAESGVPCFEIPCDALENLSTAEMITLAFDAAAATILSGAVLCLTHFKTELQARLDRLFSQMPQPAPIFLLSDQANCPIPMIEGRILVCWKVDALEPADYHIAQNAFCRQYQFMPPDERPPYYKLTIGQLEKVWFDSHLQSQIAGDEVITRKRFAASIHRFSVVPSVVRFAQSSAILSDLIVSSETRERLHLLLACATHYQTAEHLYASEGVGSGKGVTALLYGPPGTGKTMAAHALANELGLPLWRVDLSNILDKFIGETEKHLSSVFSAAREQNCILFFDEADALFSRRTEISSSHDRYANIETSFLLQCVEEYESIILLATNLFQNFDEAFLRRINVLVRFSSPDEALRLQIWESAFPAKYAPRPSLNLAALAHELELSPAAILAVAKTAVILACSSGTTVNRDILQLALKNELEKTGSTFPLETIL